MSHVLISPRRAVAVLGSVAALAALPVGSGAAPSDASARPSSGSAISTKALGCGTCSSPCQVVGLV